ncbi:isopentenyl-diphosphate Delta-isomerase [Phycicoccus sp. BSK3Z-2]|uniref:Isopentenyl-diphosphate Delta-isomerase n=1 Tax=Phycicoccus avicenniae TaxID=2828860 RepID=A0A941HZ96_9MICO|nr:isopentenyl-diphosphate Delta-isomerase [Phycicoccus avicenniae]MBR7742732.1 isopentenyl-diphosphate Delta-isomerase [Phycicoccus avicenniae]
MADVHADGSRADDPVPATILLETVDEEGVAIGTMEKLAAHAAPGVRHRAFSLFLLGDDGRVLLQRRAAVKYHSPGVWSNTCCGHPAPGGDPVEAAVRRVAEELGVGARDVEEAGVVEYRHEDPRTGLVEHEWNHTLVGTVVGEPHPDPDEVDAWAWADADAVARHRVAGELSVWFDDVYATARPVLAARTGLAW